MKTEGLVNALKIVLPGVATNNMVEAFTCFVIDNESVWSTNGRIFIRAKLDEPVDFKVPVPGKLLYSLLTSIGAPEIVLAEKKNELRVSTEKPNKLKGRIKVLETGLPDFPGSGYEVDGSDEADWRDCSPEMLYAVWACSFTASSDQSLGPLTGVLVDGDKVMSCDRYRVSKYSLRSDTGMQVIIPVELAQEVSKHNSVISHYAIDGDKILFRSEGNRLLLGGSIIPGEFPDLDPHFAGWEDQVVIPIPSSELKACVRRHSLIQSDLLALDQAIDLTIEGTTITIKSQSDTGAIEEEIEVEKKFPDAVSVKINPTFFGEILERCSAFRCSEDAGTLMFEASPLLHLLKVAK